MSDERCPTCDREQGNVRKMYLRPDHCWRQLLQTVPSTADCEANRVDWRVRYLNDIEGARALIRASTEIEKAVKAERDRLRAFVETVRDFNARDWELSSSLRNGVAKLIKQAQRVLRGESET